MADQQRGKWSGCVKHLPPERRKSFSKMGSLFTFMSSALMAIGREAGTWRQPAGYLSSFYWNVSLTHRLEAWSTGSDPVLQTSLFGKGHDTLLTPVQIAIISSLVISTSPNLAIETLTEDASKRVTRLDRKSESKPTHSWAQAAGQAGLPEYSRNKGYKSPLLDSLPTLALTRYQQYTETDAQQWQKN